MNNMENYKNLLMAIFNSDDFDDKGRIYPIIIYDCKKNEMPIGVFKNASSCAEFLNTNSETVRSFISLKSLWHDRFRIEKVTEEGEK